MDSILLKVAETEQLGFNYVFIIHDSSSGKAILRCSQAAQGFIDATYYIQDFLEYFNKFNVDLEDIPINNNAQQDIFASKELKDNYKEANKKPSVPNISLVKNRISNAHYKTNLLHKVSRKKLSISTTENLYDTNDRMSSDNVSISTTSQGLLETNIPTQKEAEKSLFEVIMPNIEENFDNELFANGVPNILYKCLMCEKAFKTADTVEIHCWIHEKKSKDGLVDLTDMNLITRMYQCRYCERSFSDQHLLKLHTWTHTNAILNRNIQVKKYECTVCDKAFQTDEQYKKHNYNVHVDSFSACGICGKLVRSRKMKEHIRKVHRSSCDIKCPKCPKLFKWAASLTMHLEDHAAREAGISDTFECAKCHKTFVSEVRLKNHLRRSCSKKKALQHSILCPICGHHFSTNITLTVHLRLKHADVGLSGVTPLQNFLCNICNRFYASKSKLKVHSRCHTGEKPFHCEFCNKAFAFKHYLRKHNKNLFCLQTLNRLCDANNC